MSTASAPAATATFHACFTARLPVGVSRTAGHAGDLETISRKADVRTLAAERDGL